MKTTASIPLSLIKYISFLISDTDIKENEIIIACLARYVDKICGKTPNIMNRAVSYQPRGKYKYKIVHVSFSWDSYNMNKLCRFSRCVSVSSMISTAIRLYAEEMAKKLHSEEKSDNYQITHFLITSEISVKSIKSYKLDIQYTKKRRKRRKKRNSN